MPFDDKPEAARGAQETLEDADALDETSEHGEVLAPLQKLGGLAGSRGGRIALFRQGKICGTYEAEEGWALFREEVLKHTKARRKQF